MYISIEVNIIKKINLKIQKKTVNKENDENTGYKLDQGCPTVGPRAACGPRAPKS